MKKPSPRALSGALKKMYQFCAFLSTLTSSKPPKRPFLDCIFGKGIGPASMLYDSGAEASLISLRLWRRIAPSLRPKRLPVNIKAKSASGNALTTHGCYLLPMKVLGRTIVHPFWVCSNLSRNSGGILGIDWIRRNKVSLNAITGAPQFEVATTPMSNAVLTESIFLPARCATLASVEVEREGQMSLSIKVPGCPQIFENEVLINSNSSRRAQVYLSNISPVAQRLPRGAVVGVAECVTEDELFPWHPGEEFSVSDTTPFISKSDQAKMKRKTPDLTESRKKQIIEQAKSKS